MKKPVFKHERESFIMSILGHLSEDAARIAVEEILKVNQEFVEFVQESIHGESNEKYQISRFVEKAHDIANNEIELIICLVTLGRMQEHFDSVRENPLMAMMQGMMVKRKK